MNRLFGARWTVACWEFRRYVKLKDQVIGLVSLLLGALISFGAVHLARSSSQIELAVIGASPAFALPPKGNLTLAKGEHTEEEWRERVAARKIDGLLILTQAATVAESSQGATGAESAWNAKLIVRQEPTWLSELKPLLQGERMQYELQVARIEPATLARILTPADVQVLSLADREISAGDRLVAYLILGATILTSWIGLAYMLTGITGEKQQRVTEQIVSAIRPQMWIDGKLLGITGAAVCSLAFLMITPLIALPVASLMGIRVPWPESLRHWELIPLFAAFYFGGVLFWNCFYAGVTAIINDPNTSSRSALLFLPMLPMFAASLVVTQPDGTIMRTLSLLPGTSSTAMPMRLVLGEVMAGEVLISLVLLFVGIAVLRQFAGRVFAAGIMLYGKEPSWLDVARWALGQPLNIN